MKYRGSINKKCRQGKQHVNIKIIVFIFGGGRDMKDTENKKGVDEEKKIAKALVLVITVFLIVISLIAMYS